MFKLFSWNVNGFRAVLGKGFAEWVTETMPDVLCLQEVKAMEEQVDLAWAEELGYEAHWNSAEKKGYSGTCTLTKIPTVSATAGIGVAEHDTEGRVVTTDHGAFYLVNVYTPNSQAALKRLPYRLSWDAAFLAHLKKLEAEKPVVFCGDLNVAHEEIDLRNPKTNRKNPGFSDDERASFTTLLDAGFIDTFRHQHPGEPDHYSWWSYRANARANNVGWRIDYFGVSKSLLPAVRETAIHPDVLGSDHCPVSLVLDI